MTYTETLFVLLSDVTGQAVGGERRSGDRDNQELLILSEKQRLYNNQKLNGINGLELIIWGDHSDIDLEMKVWWEKLQGFSHDTLPKKLL